MTHEVTAAIRRGLKVSVGEPGVRTAQKPRRPAARSASDIRVLSFFTGGGGLDLGFESVGFDVLRASDIDPPSCKTLELNKGTFLSRRLDVVCEDIRETQLDGLPKDIELIIGGPPCQSFSASGRRAGGAPGRLDDRGNLFKAYCDVVGAVRPRAFVFENVRGILSTNRGQDWEDIVAAFAALGYKLTYRILDALDFGAPQQRERMFLIGCKDDVDFHFPQPTHGPDSPTGDPYVTAREAMHGINEDEDLERLRLVDGKYAHLLPEVPPGQNYLYFTAKRGYPRPIFAYRSRFSDFLYKADPDQPVKTLIARPGKYTGPLHWDNRYFSIKEYMRLQGFPDGYQFYGSRDEIIRQIGNSVSPKIAERLALAILQQVFDGNVDVALLDPKKELSFDRRKSLKAQRTKRVHAAVAARQSPSVLSHFHPISYTGCVTAGDATASVQVEKGAQRTRLETCLDDSTDLFAKFDLLISSPQPLRLRRDSSITYPDAYVLKVVGYGGGEKMPQLIWNAVDDWVQRASHYHSLFELFGHFTEPYPIFDVRNFRRHDDSPWSKFMEFAADLRNCCRYLPKVEVLQLFEGATGWENFADVARRLRDIRFDVRSRETNIAIPADQLIIAYPFTLPHRRQMNFRVRTGVNEPIEAAA